MRKAAIIVSFVVGILPAMAFADTTRSANFEAGNRVVVSDAVKVRTTASGDVIGSQLRGANGTLKGNPVVTAGYTWWNVDYDVGPDGWSAEDFMQLSTVALAPAPGHVAGVSISHDELVAQLLSQLLALQTELAALQAAHH